MIKLDQVRTGSVVMVRDDFGRGQPKQGTVNETYEEIKNGSPGIDYFEQDGSISWAYLNQVDRVVTY